VTGNWNQPNRLYLNNGTANPFNGVSGSDISGELYRTYAVELGDVDGDGDLDLVTGNWNQPNRLYLNNGSADPFAGAIGSAISADVHATTSLALGDVGGGQTDDQRQNKLAHIAFDGDADCNGSWLCFDRLDYVYVKPNGIGARLVPTRATVLRDWKFLSRYPGGFPPVPVTMDLSDHYPLMVTFRLVPVPSNLYLPVVLRSY
jgi:hypothetical protein